MSQVKIGKKKIWGKNMRGLQYPLLNYTSRKNYLEYENRDDVRQDNISPQHWFGEKFPSLVADER